MLSLPVAGVTVAPTQDKPVVAIDFNILAPPLRVQTCALPISSVADAKVPEVVPNLP